MANNLASKGRKTTQAKIEPIIKSWDRPIITKNGSIKHRTLFVGLMDISTMDFSTMNFQTLSKSGVEKSGHEKFMVEKFMVAKCMVEKFVHTTVFETKM